jgi:hypothetical protein
MVMKLLFVTLAALAVSVNAQTAICSITAPLQNFVWNIGKDAIISWINPTVPSFTQIYLEEGNPSALTPVGVLASNVPTASGQYTFVVPANLTPGTTYALVIGTQPNVCYSPQFTIAAGSGVPSTSGNSTAPATSATGVVTSSAASSSAASSSAASSSAASSSAAPTSNAPLLSTIPSTTSPATMSTNVASSPATKSAAMSNVVQVRNVLGAIGFVGLIMMML